MDIRAEKQPDNSIMLHLDFVSYKLSNTVAVNLKNILDHRLNNNSEAELESLEIKIRHYRELANKLNSLDAIVIQTFLLELNTKQKVILARLAAADSFYNKILLNLSKQNQKQFKEDYDEYDEITYHQAALEMERMIPLIRKAAQKQRDQS
jgi:flagellar motor switch protein FliG